MIAVSDLSGRSQSTGRGNRVGSLTHYGTEGGLARTLLGYVRLSHRRIYQDTITGYLRKSRSVAVEKSFQAPSLTVRMTAP